MPKHYTQKNSIGFSLPVVLILVSFLSLAVVGGAVLTKESTPDEVLGSKSSGKPENKEKKSSNSNKNSDKGKSSMNSEKDTKTFIQDVNKAAGQLKKAASTEKAVGNKTVGQELEEIANSAESDTQETTEAIEAVESKPAWKVFLTGPDYKNLGQLRSSLVHNRNETAKLTRALTSVKGYTSDDAITAQLLVLEQERERITSVITENESQFSVLGWVSKLLAGYKTGDGDDADETTPSGTTTEPADTLNPTE
jgi:hypothetical protein